MEPKAAVFKLAPMKIIVTGINFKKLVIYLSTLCPRFKWLNLS